jgi:hypothetical protein
VPDEAIIMDNVMRPGEKVLVQIYGSNVPDVIGKCACGGDCVRIKGKLEWACKRLKWWKFWDRKHVHAKLSSIKQFKVL